MPTRSTTRRSTTKRSTATRSNKSFPSLSRAKKTSDMIRSIETQINTMSKQTTLTPAMRKKIKELQRVHADLKRTYQNYVNMAAKRNVSVMFSKVLKTIKRRPRR